MFGEIDKRKIYMIQYRKDNAGKIRIKAKQWRANNQKEIKEYKIQWNKNNPQYHKKYYEDNIIKENARGVQWAKDNPEKIKVIQDRYRTKNSELIKERDRQYRKNNPEIIKERSRIYRIKNSERINEKQRNDPEYLKQYYQKLKKDNPEKAKDNQKKRTKLIREKRRTDIKFKINSRMSNEMYKSLRGKKKGMHWGVLAGYNISDLIEKLKSTMPKGYTWQDYLAGKLHIDHIIPISVFNFTKIEHTDFKRCWALSNLQLLPAKENMAKHAKLTKPFQPALRI